MPSQKTLLPQTQVEIEDRVVTDTYEYGSGEVVVGEDALRWRKRSDDLESEEDEEEEEEEEFYIGEVWACCQGSWSVARGVVCLCECALLLGEYSEVWEWLVARGVGLVLGA